jgi:hypothetical protein
MPVYKFDLPGDAGDLFINYSVVDGELYINEQRIKWANRSPENAMLSGTADDNGNFSISVIFSGGKYTATYTGKIGFSGTGKGTAKSSWQGNFNFDIKKTGVDWLDDL